MLCRHRCRSLLWTPAALRIAVLRAAGTAAKRVHTPFELAREPGPGIQCLLSSNNVSDSAHGLRCGPSEDGVNAGASGAEPNPTSCPCCLQKRVCISGIQASH
ncbi:uncharacterized protein LOC130454925 [Monodelphis domestica]|uniref:uncharacterized protein LOC130454925 n=1 Tax=Monodelphis domestica TaxID=13616 RepID=UPI0024E20F7E|nr:uncharacterized protein LOC130454925 [Monodelphis domestica]